MKQVVIQSFCDLCADEGREGVAADGERTFDGYLLDLCEMHETKVAELLVVLNGMFKQGAPVEQEVTVPRKRGRPVGRPRNEDMNSLAYRTCQDCGYVTPTRSAMGQHVKQRHGKVLGDYTWST